MRTELHKHSMRDKEEEKEVKMQKNLISCGIGASNRNLRGPCIALDFILCVSLRVKPITSDAKGQGAMSQCVCPSCHGMDADGHVVIVT